MILFFSLLLSLLPWHLLKCLLPDSLSRPVDVLLPTRSHGCLDVHVISPLEELTLHQKASSLGHVLEVGIQCKWKSGSNVKLAAHLSACRDVGVDFTPIVVETLGRLDQESCLLYMEADCPTSQQPKLSRPNQPPLPYCYCPLVGR